MSLPSRLAPNHRWMYVTLLIVTVAAGCRRNAPLRFAVTLTSVGRSAPFDGRLLVMLSKDPAREPRMQISNNTAATQQIFGIDVEGVQPGGTATIDGSA